MSNSSINELFYKKIPIHIKISDREDKFSKIDVCIEVHNCVSPTQSKELVIRLTDSTDLFFLYSLHLGENDFQRLKMQQGLLVDFNAFPQKFIDLLELCLQEEHKDSPKFIIDLMINGQSEMGAGVSVLNVIETNPFKHLVHLSLKFMPGTDVDVKKYLAQCLETLKTQNDNLMNKYQHSESDLTLQLRQAREALSTRTQELDSLRLEWNHKIREEGAKHVQELSEQKEKYLQEKTAVQSQYESEKRDLESKYMFSAKQLETRLHHIESSNKDLTDHKYKSESLIRELRTKVTGLEEELSRSTQELTSLRKSNASLDSDHHGQEKLINQLKTQLAVSEQEVKTKEEVLQKTSVLMDTEQQYKKKFEEDLHKKQKQIHKLETSVKTVSDELIKGNEIIKKLQTEIRNYHSKLKLRNQITFEQEKLLGEKAKEMETIRKELESAKTDLKNRQDENLKLSDQLETALKKLDESRQLLKTNENVINWLNKQITETQVHHQRFAQGQGQSTIEMNSTGNSSVGLRQYSNPSSLTPNMQFPARFARSELPGSSVTPPIQPIPKHMQQQLLYHQGRFTGPGHPASLPGYPTSLPGHPLAKSSPISAMNEEHKLSNRDPESSADIKQKENNAVIDTKYFRSGQSVRFNKQTSSTHDENPLPAPPVTSAAISILFNSEPHAAESGSQPHRLSRELITNKPPAPQAPQSSALASAYFPDKATVS